jgi:hypothetical protein
MTKKIELLTKLKDLFEEYNVEVYVDVEEAGLYGGSGEVTVSIEDITDGTKYISSDCTSIDPTEILKELNKETGES